MSLRAYLAPTQWEEGTLTLPREEAHHITQVRRAEIGAEIEVLDGQGRKAQTRLTGYTKKSASLEVLEVSQTPKSNLSLTLASAMLPASRWDWLLQKATELGAASIVPLVTERTQERKQVRLDRWQGICIAAIKQSGNPWLPELHEPKTLRAFMEGHSDHLLLLAQEAAAPHSLETVLCQDTAHQRVVCMTGPEGGFTPGEIEEILQQGAQTVCLGPHTLRAETAAISFLAGINLTLGKATV